MLFNENERELAGHFAGLVYANPFLADRIAHERGILGAEYAETHPYWSLLPDLDRKTNLDLIAERCAALVATLHARLQSGAAAGRDELQLYDDVVIYFLYDRYREDILGLIDRGETQVPFYSRFRADARKYLGDRIDPAHLFACFYQVRRAFDQIFRNIIGLTSGGAVARRGVAVDLHP